MTKQKFSIKHIPTLLKETYQEWMDEEPFDQSAIVAYYSIFSLPALLMIIVSIAGAVFGQEAVQGKITDEITKVMGPESAKEIENMISQAYKSDAGTIGTIVGILTLIFGATGVFVALQKSLNRTWEVKPDPHKSGFMKLIMDRILSFGIVIVIAFLMLISLVITTTLSLLTGYIQHILPDFLIVIFHIFNFLLSMGVVTMVFAMIYRFLPDAKIKWRSVWVGSIVTATLFIIGKYALTFYFLKADPASAYGAAGTVILILLWVSYSCMIMFFGAEFTQVYARKYVQDIIPSGHAVRSEDYYEDKKKGIKPDE
jgi:membrane protein